MSGSILYIDCSEVREGKLEELKSAMSELVGLVHANEPRLIAYNAYFTEDGTRMTVVHVHPDSDSLKLHMKVSGPSFPKFVELLRLLTIDLSGEPGDDLVEQMRRKARMLGDGTVRVHGLHAGFARFGNR